MIIKKLIKRKNLLRSGSIVSNVISLIFMGTPKFSIPVLEALSSLLGLIGYCIHK